MTPAQVAAKFRQYIDEPDQTFVSDKDAEVYLSDGYREFRNMVCDINPMVYNTTEPMTFSSERTHDLSVATASAKSVLGATPTADRMIRLNAIRRVDSDGNVIQRLEAVSNPQSLDVVPGSYYLANTILRFSSSITGDYEVDYVPEAAIVWTGVAPTAFLDDLTSFHDLVALLAYRQYAIIDGAESEPVLRQAATRMREFLEYLQARAFDGYDYVQPVSWLS
mgnify:FL=1|tara:strand:+ start:751 stop:1416 length:666 start_codon:yes stop_codon:yes gene_type:complete